MRGRLLKSLEPVFPVASRRGLIDGRLFMENIDDIRELPELAEDTIHIWGVYIPDMQHQRDALHGLLCEHECKKAARFYRDTDRHSSIVARGALRVLLSGYTGIPPSEITFTYSKNGKPQLTGSDVTFNISHSSDWVVLAIGRERAVGVDIEQIKWEMDVQSVAERYFSPEEIAWIRSSDDQHRMFFQLWAHKEAYVKACGSTLFTELKRMSVPIEDGAEKEGWYFHRLEAGSKYAAAVVTDRPLAGLPCYDFGGLKWHP